MIYTLSDGMEVKYHVLMPADATAAVAAIPDDARMFLAVTRRAVVEPEKVLRHIGGLPDSARETTLLGTDIMVASLQAHARRDP
jgi:hypothetical protein